MASTNLSSATSLKTFSTHLLRFCHLGSPPPPPLCGMTVSGATIIILCGLLRLFYTRGIRPATHTHITIFFPCPFCLLYTKVICRWNLLNIFLRLFTRKFSLRDVFTQLLVKTRVKTIQNISTQSSFKKGMNN